MRNARQFTAEKFPDTLLSVFSTALVNLYTRDIEAALRFYRDQLGFVETFRTPRHGAPDHIELQLAGFTVCLGTVQGARRLSGAGTEPSSPAIVMVVWTDDVDATCLDLITAGVAIVQPPHDAGNNERKALLRDPDGNLVEIVARKI